MKPLTLGAGHLWVLMSPWRMDVKWYMKCFIYWTHKWPAPNVSGFIAQLVQTPLKSWLFQVSIRNCLNCVHNCDDHSLLDFKSAVQYMKHFMYHFTKGTLLSRMQKVHHCCRQVPPLLQTEAAVYTLWPNDYDKGNTLLKHKWHAVGRTTVSSRERQGI